MAEGLMLTTGPSAATRCSGLPGMREPVLVQPAEFHCRYPAWLSPRCIGARRQSWRASSADRFFELSGDVSRQCARAPIAGVVGLVDRRASPRPRIDCPDRQSAVEIVRAMRLVTDLRRAATGTC
jgi:hypothetical protein